MSDADVSYEKRKPGDTLHRSIEPQPDYDNDDGILHYEPRSGLQPECDAEAEDKRTLQKTNKLQLIQEIFTKPQYNNIHASPARKAGVYGADNITKTTPRRKRKGNEGEDVQTPGKGPKMTDEEVFETMRSLIQANQPLYLRILRYEVSCH